MKIWHVYEGTPQLEVYSIKFIGFILVSMSTSNVFSDMETCHVSKLGIPFHGYSLVEGLKFSWKINLLGKCHTRVALSASQRTTCGMKIGISASEK